MSKGNDLMNKHERLMVSHAAGLGAFDLYDLQKLYGIAIYHRIG